MTATPKHLRDLRRDLHRHPEPAWREFRTTARILQEFDRIGIADVYVGPEALDADARSGVPGPDELERWRDRARAAGVEEATIERFADGQTGAVAVLQRGEGPTIGLRVDIDALPRSESTDPDHEPESEGFRSQFDDAMHACGHDAHATIGIGVLEAIADSDFRGTLKVFFQPAEEVIGGGRALAESGHLDDVQYLLAIHVGLDHPTGEIVAGVDGILAVSNFEATFSGEPSHAGGHPERGANAVQAMAAAVQNLYAISRHGDGATRVNAGDVGGGSARNVIPESAYIRGEVRGETTHLMEYMRERADDVLESAGSMYDCAVTIEETGVSPSATPDEALVDLVADTANDVSDVESILRRAKLGGSEDATYLMQEVQDNGGLATYVGIGSDHPGGHHTETFDLDEASIGIGIEVLRNAILAIEAERP